MEEDGSGESYFCDAGCGGERAANRTNHSRTLVLLKLAFVFHFSNRRKVARAAVAETRTFALFQDCRVGHKAQKDSLRFFDDALRCSCRSSSGAA